MKNIVMTGSTNWQDQVKLKKTIFSLRQRLGDGMKIISGGLRQGADYYIKKVALNFEIEYGEIPPFDHSWTAYCIEPAYKYNKVTNTPKYISMKNDLLSEICDVLVIFVDDTDEYKNCEDLIKRCQKKGKKVIVIK